MYVCICIRIYVYRHLVCFKENSLVQCSLDPVCVCVCVCTYVCMYMYMYLCVPTFGLLSREFASAMQPRSCVCVYVYVCMRTTTCFDTLTHTCVCMCMKHPNCVVWRTRTHIHSYYPSACIYGCIYAYTPHPYMHTHMYVCT